MAEGNSSIFVRVNTENGIVTVPFVYDNFLSKAAVLVELQNGFQCCGGFLSLNGQAFTGDLIPNNTYDFVNWTPNQQGSRKRSWWEVFFGSNQIAVPSPPSAQRNVQGHHSILRFHIDSVSGNVTTENGLEGAARDGEMLVLDELPDEFALRYGRDAIPRNIYIRRCYVELYDLVTAEMIIQETNTPAILLTGVPGIGKSMLMIYFLCRFQTDARFLNKSFAFEIDHGIYHYYKAIAQPTSHNGVTMSQFMCSVSVTRHAVPLTEILVVADIPVPTQPQSRAKWSLIFSSPNAKRYVEFMKNSPHYTYLVPTWSEYELWCANENIDDWYKRFVICGGVPRLVFWKGGDDPLGIIERALKEKGTLVYFFTHDFGSIDSDNSYALVHINPPTLPDGKVLYHCTPNQVVYTFASDYIFKELKSVVTNGLASSRILSCAVNWFNTECNFSSSKLGVVSAGHLFEKICLWLVPLSGKQISIAKLPQLPPTVTNTRSSLPIHVPPMKQLRGNWTDLHNHDIGYLYQPLTSDLESGVAFGVIKRGVEVILIVLQFTVDEIHPVKANDLKNIVQAYPQDIRDQITRKMIVFVTPVDGKLSTVQPIHSHENRILAPDEIPNYARDFEQWLYRYFIEM